MVTGRFADRSMVMTGYQKLLITLSSSSSATTHSAALTLSRICMVRADLALFFILFLVFAYFAMEQHAFFGKSVS